MKKNFSWNKKGGTGMNKFQEEESYTGYKLEGGIEV